MTKRRSSWEIRTEADRMVQEYKDHAEEERPEEEEDWEANWWMSWNHLADERDEKVLACKVTRERAMVEEEFAREKARQWTARARRMKSLSKRMNDVCIALISEMGDDAVDMPDGGRARLYVRKGYELEGDLDVDRLPLRFVKREIARGDLKLALRKGEEVEGVTLKEKKVRCIMWSI